MLYIRYIRIITQHYYSHHITTICHIVLYYTAVWYLGYNSNNTCYTKVHSIAYIA